MHNNNAPSHHASPGDTPSHNALRSERRDVIVGLDAGTSVIKAVAFAGDGRELAKTQCANQVHHRPGGAVEQGLDDTWRAARTTLDELFRQHPELADRLGAIAVTGQGDGTWLIDDAGRPVGDAMLWLDNRSSDIVSHWRASRAGPDSYRLTGTGLNQSIQSGQLRWLKDHHPEQLERAATVFHCKDWLYYCLTGQRATDPAEALWTYGDVKGGHYSEAVLAAYGLSEMRDKLPPIVDGSRHHAPLDGQLAQALGLCPGVPVVLAPVDMLATALGAGVYEPGRRVACSIIGTTGAHLCVREDARDIVLSNQSCYTMPCVAPDTWVQLCSNMAATLNLEWFIKGMNEMLTALGEAPMSTDGLLPRLDKALAATEPGRLIYHPFICTNGERGPFFNPRARAQFLGLSAECTHLHMARAIYEGVAFAARDCYQALEAHPEELRLTGGAAQSRTLCTILASVMGVPVRTLSRGETGAAGAAMVASLCLGRHRDLADACATWVTPFLAEDRVMPDPDLHNLYERLYGVYRRSYASADGFWRHFERVRADT
ncbi:MULTISPECIES: FGGY-family carbohydrate kinase [unclassified Halomonas]|uniref:FGGY-family carbohydrate kinase n=1 Tax=unclassified Halomonas TaxID=2609666 RepID=UPI001C970D33|nr:MULTISPECIES: FGGY-family carbohydrate kinase [unclassified Halomonas]MBY5924706.1 carbohydrate kinase [Halomonas sp. DP4Y7-2]MBY6231748.1 carbohydrate kinase [Halomonas sp. DP4Y7-1]